eukprot:366336-Chlamydomonas_euryale.AAC.17
MAMVIWIPIQHGSKSRSWRGRGLAAASRQTSARALRTPSATRDRECAMYSEGVCKFLGGTDRVKK